MGYNVEAVKLLTGLTGRQVRYWDTVGIARPSVRAARGRGSRRLYSFDDLVALRTGGHLRDAGISTQKIRILVKKFREERKVDRPLSTVRFLILGKEVLSSAGDPQRWESVLNGGQIVVFVPIDKFWVETETKVRSIAQATSDTVTVGGKRYRVVLEPDLEDGGWVAECPSIPGCVSQGETLGDAKKMIRDAIAVLHAEDAVPRQHAR